MKSIKIFDIVHFPTGIQLGVEKTAIEKAMTFKSMMKDRGIDTTMHE